MTRSLRDFFWFDAGIYNESMTTMSTSTTSTITPFVSTTMTTNSTTATFVYDQNAIVANMMWDLYDSFNHVQPDYLLITLYVPVIALAVTANALVIAVVFKYHYMRRYVLFIISVYRWITFINYVLKIFMDSYFFSLSYFDSLAINVYDINILKVGSKVLPQIILSDCYAPFVHCNFSYKIVRNFTYRKIIKMVTLSLHKLIRYELYNVTI